jgi:hypothetical protein
MLGFVLVGSIGSLAWGFYDLKKHPQLPGHKLIKPIVYGFLGIIFGFGILIERILK